MVGIEGITRETKDFVDKYYIEFLNTKSCGEEVLNWLESNFPESLRVLRNPELLEKITKNLERFLRLEKS